MILIFSLPTNLPFYAIYPELFVASKTGKYSLFELVKKLCHVHSEANTAFKFLKTILEVYFITSPRNIDSMIHITGDFLCKWSLDKPENLKEKNSLGFFLMRAEIYQGKGSIKRVRWPWISGQNDTGGSSHLSSVWEL